jgi:sugar phosphate isomerase/epimerase
MASWNLPPIHVASHWLGEPCTTPDADWELLEFWSERAFQRLAGLGVKTAGVYGLFFPRVEGYSETRQMDQAIRYVSFLGDTARKYDMQVALEPMADLHTLWPTYLEGLNFARRVGHPNVRVMADMAYFLKLDQPFEIIREAPDVCLHVHIAGEGGQPGLGDRVEVHKQLFRVLRDIGYERAVSCACPWKSSDSGPFEFGKESKKTLAYLQALREEVYNE